MTCYAYPGPKVSHLLRPQEWLTSVASTHKPWVCMAGAARLRATVSTLRRAWARLTSLFRRDELDREFDEDEKAHRASVTDEYARRGMSRDQAERLARRTVGLAPAAKDAHRDGRGIVCVDALQFDMRQAFRGLYRDRAFAVAAVTTLVVAITLNVSVFTVRDAMLFRGLPGATQSDRLVYLALRKPSDLPCCPGPVPYTVVEAWRAEAHALQGIAMWRSGEPITFRDGDGRPADMTLSRWSANTLGILGVQPALGRDFVAADERPGAPQVALISHAFWERRFGRRADIVGLVVQINGAPATIVGVLPEGFALLYEHDLWMPLPPSDALDGNVVGRLREGATIPDAQAQVDTITRRLQADGRKALQGVPLVRTYAQAFVAADAPTIYGALWTGAWFVFLIACTNLTNLTLVRTTGRWREWSTRVALGAGQARMVRQMLLECGVLAAVAAPIAWSLTKWGVGLWEEATRSRYLALDYSVTGGTLAYLLALSVLAACLMALAPIARVLQLGVSEPLKGDARGVTRGVRGKRLSEVLVGAQMALAVVLLLGAGVLMRSFVNIVSADTGVREADSITVGLVAMPSDTYPTAASRAAFVDRLMVRLRMIAGIEEASVASTIPARGIRLTPTHIEGRPATVEDAHPEQVMTIGPDYFRTLGRSMISGRDLNLADEGGAPLVVLVNQSFAANWWGGEQALGKRVRFIEGDQPGPWRTVVGVAPDIMQGEQTRQRFRPVIYVPFKQRPSLRTYVFVQSALPSDEAAKAVLAEVQNLDPDVTTEDFTSLDARLAFDRDWMDLEHADLGKYAAIAPTFAVVALLLASIGLVAVVAHSVSQRTKEIGVRMAIGAANHEIARMILREGMRPVVIGLCFGLVASAGANRLLQSQLVGVSPYDLVTMAGGPLVLLFVAVAGCTIPSWRAMRVNPVEALRHE